MCTNMKISPAFDHVGAVDVTVWAPGEAVEHPMFAGRVTIGVYTGCVTMHLRPTVAEAEQLIALIQNAIDAS